MVAICPYLSHLDPRLYPDEPLTYNPARHGMRLDGAEAVGGGGSSTLSGTSGTPTGGSSGATAGHAGSQEQPMHSVAVGVGGLAGISFGGGKYR